MRTRRATPADLKQVMALLTLYYNEWHIQQRDDEPTVASKLQHPLGYFLAFIDDDCEPASDWLKTAGAVFADRKVVGVEGRVVSSRYDDPAWRAVSNDGIVGIAFMTANLLVRSAAFNRLNGFDIAFEEPHFREDTDFGWRLQTLGKVPYEDDVCVYHPPHRRNVARESQATRDSFFEKDALLLKKHPERYAELLKVEHHWTENRGYWPHMARGAVKYNVALPRTMVEMLLRI